MSSSLQKLLNSRKALAGAAPIQAPAPGAASPGFKMPTMPTASSATGWMLGFLFYTSATILLIFLLLVFVHYTVKPIFKLTAGDPGFIQIAGGPTQTVWLSGPAAPDTAAPIDKPVSCDYSISFDVLVSGAYSSITAPRVLLYRSANPVPLTSTTKVDALMSLFTGSNLLIYIDNLKNDLNVIAYTAVNGQTTAEAAPPVTNVPLGTAFRLSVVYTPQFMEIYMNATLVSTRMFKGQPIQSTTPFMSPPNLVSSLVRISRLSYWPRPVMAADLRLLGNAPPIPSFTELPPPPPAAPPPPSTCSCPPAAPAVSTTPTA